MSVKAEQIAAQRLRDWLLLALPAKVTEVNLLRAATLTAPWAGPYNIPAASSLQVCVTADSSVYVAAPLTTGAARTATQVAADINAVGGLVGVAGADSQARLTITSLLPPTAAAASVVQLDSAAVNSVFGWDLGGGRQVLTALVAPNDRQVCDGLPLLPDFGNTPGGGAPIVVVIGDRSGRPRDNIRRDEYEVTLDVSILRAEPQQQVHRTREHIHSAVRCVREVLQQNQGRHLGSVSDIMLVLEKQCRVAALPFKFQVPKEFVGLNPLYDGASMLLEVRVFEVPGQT